MAKGRFAGLVLAAVLAGCSRDDAPGAPAAPGLKLPPARTLPIPAGPAGVEAPARGGLIWQIPSDWTAVEPSSRLRLAQYRLDGPGGEAECVVYYFGPRQGGDPLANAERWAGQFEQPGGGSSIDAMRLSELAGTAVAVHLVEVSGTYDGGMSMTDAPPVRMPGYMLLGGIAAGPDAPWFFKLTGPEATVRAQREAFVRMMGSVRPGG